MNSRIERLKSKLLQDDDNAIFYERMKLLLEAERQYSNESPGKKYAHCFAYMLDHMTVEIRPDELIVGISKEIVPTEAQEKEFLFQASRHNLKATDLFSFDAIGELEITDIDERFAPEFLGSYGHLIPDWGKLLQKGYGGLKAEALSYMGIYKDDARKLEFLENAVTVCEAMTRFAGRYAAEAGLLLEETQSPEEMQRLALIGQTCESCAGGGATGFREALQLIWFTMMVMHTVCGARDYAYGRFDQYLYPYYKKDVDAGLLTQAQALELIECLFIKTNEIIGMTWEAYEPKRILSVNSLQYIMLGGADGDGNDTSNELSFLVLKAVDELKIKQPTLNIRYHPNINEDFMKEACRIAATGIGNPAYFNDTVMVQALQNNGVSLEDAIDYTHYGCNNSYLPGKEDSLREAWHCVPKYLEYALNHGRSMLTGKIVGAITPHAHYMQSMDDVYEALRVQIAHGVKMAKDHVEQSDAYWNEIQPFNFESVIMTGCLEKAQSMGAGGSKQRHLNNHFVGMATVANSLYALEEIVFKQKKYSLEEFIRLLKNDWADDEYTRKYIKEKYPKFGNDDDRVDDIARKVGLMYVKEVQDASPMDNGRKLYPSFYSLWHHRAFGLQCAASADGRHAGEELSESQSPSYGTEEHGPTAALNSIAKLPFNQTPTGGLNMKFQPKLLAGDSGVNNLAALIRAYFAQGGMHMQINVVSRQALQDAKENPEQHKNLLVRVVGYSAYFVSLSPDQQDEIIERPEYKV